MKTKSKYFAAAASAFLFAACGGQDTATPTSEAADPAPSPTTVSIESTAPNALAEVATATYSLEPTHASLVWTISHNGLSNYTARFASFDATLNFDATDPTGSTLSATIDPTSVRTSHPTDTDWNSEIATDEKFLNATVFPSITFTSTGITMTGDTTGMVVGDLTLLGVTQQVALDVTFNGVRNFAWFGERDVIGFSATSTLKRSEFGMTALLPDIGDEIAITIEAEFLQDE